MPREVVQVQGHVPLAPEAAWAVVRDFCGAWHPWVDTIREERGSQGARIRAFTVAGDDAVYREQQTYLSDSDRVIGYTHLEGIRDCEAYNVRLTVTPAEAGGSVIGWTATVRAPAARLRAICEGTKAVFEAGIAALAELCPSQGRRVENAAPTPGVVRLQTEIFDDLPRLALTVTAPTPQPSPTRGEEGSRLPDTGPTDSTSRLPSPRGEGMGVGGREVTRSAFSCTGSAVGGRTGWNNWKPWGA